MEEPARGAKPSSMLLKELASTGVHLPEIGFGIWNYARGVEPLRAAMQYGAPFGVTATARGATRSSMRERISDLFSAIVPVECQHEEGVPLRGSARRAPRNRQPGCELRYDLQLQRH